MPIPHGAAFNLGAALRLVSSPLLLVLLAVLAMYVGAEVGLTAWVSPLMEEVLGSPRAAAGMAVSVFWIFMAVGRLGVSVLAIRYRPAPIVIALAVGSALSGLVVARAPGVSSCLAGSAASGLFMSGIFGLVMTDAARWFPQRTGAAFGLVIAGVGVGALVVPAVMGFVAGVSDLRTAMLIPSVLMLIVAGVYVRLGRR
jgi:fucose permease